MDDSIKKQMWAFDFEVLKDDWIMCCKNHVTKEQFMAHNDILDVLLFLEEEQPILVGYNNKSYDNYILKGILNGLNPREIKNINDFIIKENMNGWEYPYIAPFVEMPNSSDLILDMRSISLKEIEGYLGLDITESSVPFDIDRALEKDELDELIEYCWHDVDATDRLIDERMQYLDAKIYVGELIGLEPVKSLYLTNAQLTAKVLHAKKREWNDEYDYVIPSNLKQEKIPYNVMEFIRAYQDGKIKLNDSDDEEKSKLKLDFDLFGVPHTLGLGGLHGAIRNYIEEETDKRTILIADVKSYYPSMIIVYDYLSRNVPDKQLYEDIYNKRIKAKDMGDKKTANSLKLVLNTVFGAQLNKYNELYDPLKARSICLTGQLFLIELITSLNSVPTLQLIQSNTDGIVFSFDNEYKNQVMDILNEWQQTKGLNLDIDGIKKIVQKDVNNYGMIDSNNKIKVKGAYLSNYNGGDFMNRSLNIVAKAVFDYFFYNVPVEETINNCNDPIQFQFIGKAGKTYDRVVHEYN